MYIHTIYIYVCAYVYSLHARDCMYICMGVYVYRRRMSQMESGKLVSIGIRLIMVPHRSCMNSWRGGCCNTPCHARLSYRRQHCYQRHASIGTTGLYRNTISLICPSRLSSSSSKKRFLLPIRGHRDLVRDHSTRDNCFPKFPNDSLRYLSWIRFDGTMDGSKRRNIRRRRSNNSIDVDTSDTLMPRLDTRSSGEADFFCEKYRSFYTRYKRSYYVSRRREGWELYLIKPPEAGWSSIDTQWFSDLLNRRRILIV